MWCGPESAYERSITTDRTGTALFRLLQPGEYVVRTSAPGFTTPEERAVVSVGNTATLFVRSAVQASEESVTVSGVSQGIATAEAQLSASTEAARVKALPVGTVRGPLALGGGAVLSLAFNTPGVAPNLQRSSLSNPGTFYVNGNRGRSNNITLDSATITDVVATGAMGLQTVPVDAIAEFNIISMNFNAEFGRNSGSQVQIVTRSGNNEWHGSAFDYIRNSALNARDYFDVTGRPTSLRSNDFGGTIGGPLRRDRLFAFGHVQKILTRGFSDTRLANVPTPQQAAGAPDPTARQLLTQLQVPTSANGVVANPSPQTADFIGISGRMDANLSHQDSLFVRYGFADYTFRAPIQTFWNSDLPTSGSSIANVPHNATISHTRIFGPSMVNQFVAAFGRSDPRFPPLYELGGGPHIQFQEGTSAFGWSYNLTNTRLQNTFQYLDVFTLNRGAHQWKLGADIARVQSNSFMDSYLRGAFVFANLNDFLNGRPNSFTQRFGNSNRGFRQWTQAYFLQDDFRISRTMTVNAGVRIEVNGEVNEVNGLISNLNLSRRESVGGAGEGPLGSFDVGENAYQGTVNWMPRFGFAWNPRSGPLSVRGGYGIVYDYIPLSHAYSSLRAFPPLMYEFRLSGPGLFTGSNSFANLVAGTSEFQQQARAAVGGFPAQVRNFGALTAIDSRFSKSSRTAMESDLGASIASEPCRASILRWNTKAGRLARQRPINLLAPGQFTPPATPEEEARRASSGEFARINTALSPGPDAFSNRIDRRFGAVNYLEATGNSSYHSLQFFLTRRIADGVGLTAAYTFSKSIDDVSENGFLNDLAAQQDPFNNKNNRAVSSFDLPQRLVLTWNLQPGYARRIPNQFARLVFGDWSLDGIWQIQSGMPLTILAGPKYGIPDATLVGGAGGQHADSVSSGRIDFEPDAGTGAANPSKVEKSGLAQPLVGTLGNLGRNTHRINSLTQVDVTVGKVFPMRERVRITLHFQIYNLLKSSGVCSRRKRPWANALSAREFRLL